MRLEDKGNLRPACVWRSRSETSPCGRSSRCSPECLQARERAGQGSFTRLLPSFLSHSGSAPARRPQVADRPFLPLPLPLPSTIKGWHRLASSRVSVQPCSDSASFSVSWLTLRQSFLLNSIKSLIVITCL